jgi:predicted O-linked N-acetylglucosamine transferase (SPINDLY family)
LSSIEQQFRRGIVSLQAGNLDKAERSFKIVLRSQPRHVGALNLLGVVSMQLQKYSEAEHYIVSALNKNAASDATYYNYGILLKALQRPDEALERFCQALRLNPNVAETWNNRGTVLNDLQRYGEAIADFDRALLLRPDYPDAFYNKGNSLSELWRYDEAVAAYKRALSIKPDLAEAWGGYGNALGELGSLDEALACVEKAIALKPQLAEAHYLRAGLLSRLNRGQEAVASCEQAMALRPNYAEAKLALCIAELPVLYTDEAEIPARREAYEARLRVLHDEVFRHPTPKILAKGVGPQLPFYLPYQGRNDIDLQRLYGTMACRIMADCYPPAPLPAPPGPDEPIRVGFVSAFFYEHSVWKIPTKGWIEQLDRNRFRIFGYHTGSKQDAITEHAARTCEKFLRGPLSIDRWRAAIREDSPHVLIYPEIGMNSVSAQLAAQRLAPVQCQGMGHPETTGYPTLDYVLSSDLMEPFDGENHYTEQLVRLPNLSVYYEPVETPSDYLLARADFGLRSSAIVFWCPQSLHKYLPQYDEVFPRVAREIPESQFVFIEFLTGPTELFRKRLARAFDAFGLRAEDHCVVLPRMQGLRQFLTAAGQCDIMLDSIGWSGNNSTLESLAHDLPVVTMPGPLMRGRHTMAILKMMDIGELIAETIDSYISIAVRLAQDSDWRATIKAKIAANKHRLYHDRAPISALHAFLDRVTGKPPSPAAR